MNRRLVLTALLGLSVSACAGGTPPATPAPAQTAPAPPPEAEVFDPAGTYDFTVSAQGMEMGGVMVIEGTPSAGYTGTVDTEMGGGAMSNVVVEGEILTFTMAEFGMEGELEFEGDEFVGYMSGGMGEADIFGVKRSGG